MLWVCEQEAQLLQRKSAAMISDICSRWSNGIYFVSNWNQFH